MKATAPKMSRVTNSMRQYMFDGGRQPREKNKNDKNCFGGIHESRFWYIYYLHQFYYLDNLLPILRLKRNCAAVRSLTTQRRASADAGTTRRGNRIRVGRQADVSDYTGASRTSGATQRILDWRPSHERIVHAPFRIGRHAPERH